MSRTVQRPAAPPAAPWWAVVLSIAFAAGCFLFAGVPDGRAGTVSQPTGGGGGGSSSYSGSYTESEGHNYPNFKRPRMRDGMLTGGVCRRSRWC